MQGHWAPSFQPDFPIWLPYMAAEKNAVRFAALLIAHGADLDAKNHEGFTPLHTAVEDTQNKVAKLLIAAGADGRQQRERQ